MNNFSTGPLLATNELYRILVDVDLTLVDSLSPWVNWFNRENIAAAATAVGEHKSVPFQPITKECYMTHAGDLAILMRERAHPAWITRRVFIAGQWMNSPAGRDPMDWWREPNLYADMLPLPGAHQFLNNIKAMLEENFDRVEIVAVTKCEPEHERSKRQFIQRHYHGLFDGFVSTDEKHMLAGDVLIDDNPKYVEPCMQNNIMSIFVPQGNYEKLNLSHCTEMLYVEYQEGRNHFDYLNSNIREVCQAMISHYNYVR